MQVFLRKVLFERVKLLKKNIILIKLNFNILQTIVQFVFLIDFLDCSAMNKNRITGQGSNFMLQQSR